MIAGVAKYKPLYIVLTVLDNYSQLIKLRLTLLVVFSSGIGFILANPYEIHLQNLLLLLVSGFLITGSANGINQIIEREPDKLMTRTHNRPIAAARISVAAASIFVISTGIAGAILLGAFFNSLSALLGVSSLLIYAFVYTPLKPVTPFAVVAGAITGAAPPIIGYAAVKGDLDAFSLIVFTLQFLWQFPHFWALAWIYHEDYKKAGFHLLPTGKKRNRNSALIILLTTSLLSLFTLYLFLTEWMHPVTNALILGLSLHFTYQSYKLYKTLERKEARALMFGSFYYLPLVLLLMASGQLI